MLESGGKLQRTPQQRLYCMNTFYQKPVQKKWTWRIPDGAVKNDIDYVLVTDKTDYSEPKYVLTLDWKGRSESRKS